MLENEIVHHKIYDDNSTFAILDNKPLTKGHSLVITKQQIDHLDDCPEDLYLDVFNTVHKVSLSLKKELNPKRIAIIVHGFEIPHAHVHVVPLYTGKELRLAAKDRENITQEELTELSSILYIL